MEEELPIQNGSKGLITCQSTWVHVPKISHIAIIHVHNHQNEAVHVHIPAYTSPLQNHLNGQVSEEGRRVEGE